MAKKDTDTKLEITTCDIKGIDSINIESQIHVTRGQQVMLDSDLAMLYGVETRRLNEQVKRNINRFPKDFMFQLTQDEAFRLRSQIVTLDEENKSLWSQIATLNKEEVILKSQIATSSWGGTRKRPYAFTRNGIAMLSSVLRSDTAVEVNIRIMRAFTMIPQLVNHHTHIIERIFNIEQHQQETDKTIKVILDRIEDVSPTLLPEQVFATGCIGDAWSYISDLVRSARQRIVLIDNYVDDRVLSMLTKRADRVLATIHTRYNEQFLIDLKKHNAQYPEIEFIQLPQRNHDRFLIIDDKVYLLGASLKDIGTGLCAVTEMSIAPEVILGLLS